MVAKHDIFRMLIKSAAFFTRYFVSLSHLISDHMKLLTLGRKNLTSQGLSGSVYQALNISI